MPEALAIHNAQNPNVQVALFGLGQLGGQFLTQLVYLANALQGLMGRELSVTAYDTRTVDEALLCSHRLPQHLLGQPLATSLIRQVNLASGQTWQGFSTLQRFPFDQRRTDGILPLTVAVSAFDSLKDRQRMAQWVKRSEPKLWLDLGMDDFGAQAILGRTRNFSRNPENLLPTLDQLYPDLFPDEKITRGVPEILPTQPTSPANPLVNMHADLTAILGARLLWEALQPRLLTHHGYFINLNTGQINSLALPTVTTSQP